MVDIGLREAISETLEILKNVDKYFIERLPKKFLDFLEENKSNTYIPNLDYTIDLKDQNIREETKNLLGIMYLNYWSTSEEKKEYIKLLNENEKKYEEKKYDTNNLFKIEENKNMSTEEKVINEVALVQQNESFFRKVWRKILNTLKKR